MDSKKILMATTFYPPFHLGGDAVHVKLLAQELASLGHEIHVVHLLDPYILKRGSKEAAYDPSAVNIIPIRSPYGSVSIMKSFILGKSEYIDRKVGEAIEEIKPDVIHFHNVSGFGPSIFRFNRSLRVYTAHDYWPVCPMSSMLYMKNAFCEKQGNCLLCSLMSKRPPQLWRYRVPAEWNIDKMNLVFAPSRYMASKLKACGVNAPISVLPNFVDSPRIIDVSDRSDARPYFLFVGVLEKHKGIIELIKTFKEAGDLRSDLVIVGRGSLEGYVRSECEKTGNIRYRGWVDEIGLSKLYQGARAVVVPSNWPENNPLVALEAISYGVPVIVSDNGGLPEIAENLDPGLVFRNTTELKAVLQKLENEAMPAEKVRQAYQEHYSPGSFIPRYLSSIDGLYDRPSDIGEPNKVVENVAPRQNKQPT